MVKSYQGVRKVEPKGVKPVLVKDVMTGGLITFKPDQTINQVVKILLDHRISGGPVVDGHNNLIGIISEGDCLKELIKEKYNNTPNIKGYVKDHMITDVKTIDPGVSVFEAASMFLNQRVRRFPVMKDGKLLGQISQRDILRAIENMKSETW